MTGIGERIKRIRKHQNLTQLEFGKIIGVAGNTVTNYESENREPSNAVITLICKEFGINEAWLRTGEGGDENMFSYENREDKFYLNLDKLSATQNQLVRNMINAIVETDPDKLKIIEEFMKKCLGLEASASVSLEDSEYALKTQFKKPDIAAAEAAYEKSLGIVPKKKSGVWNTTKDTEKSDVS